MLTKMRLELSIFADHTRLEILSSQTEEDLYTISAWSERWEMPSNIDKCKVLQVQTENKKLDFECNVKVKSVRCVRI